MTREQTKQTEALFSLFQGEESLPQICDKDFHWKISEPTGGSYLLPRSETPVTVRGQTIEQLEACYLFRYGNEPWQNFETLEEILDFVSEDAHRMGLPKFTPTTKG